MHAERDIVLPIPSVRLSVHPMPVGRLKMLDMENDGPDRRAGKCRIFNMTDRNPMHTKLRKLYYFI